MNNKEDKKRFFHKHYIAPIIATFISGALVALITVFVLEEYKNKKEADNIIEPEEVVREEVNVVPPPKVKSAKSTTTVTEVSSSSNSPAKASEPTMLINESYNLKISSEEFTKLEIVTPQDGNLTISLKSEAEYTYFALYNKDGVSFDPTNKKIITGNGYGASITPGDRYGERNRTSAFNLNDKVLSCYWNPTGEIFKGSFTFKLDAGTYYFHIVRGQTGLSTVNLSIQLKALR